MRNAQGCPSPWQPLFGVHRLAKRRPKMAHTNNGTEVAMSHDCQSRHCYTMSGQLSCSTAAVAHRYLCITAARGFNVLDVKLGLRVEIRVLHPPFAFEDAKLATEWNACSRYSHGCNEEWGSWDAQPSPRYHCREGQPSTTLESDCWTRWA